MGCNGKVVFKGDLQYKKTPQQQLRNTEESSALVFLHSFVYNKLSTTHTDNERAFYHSLLIHKEELLLLHKCLTQAAASL